MDNANTTHTPGPWLVDEMNQDFPKNMAQALLDDEGTDREWTAVGIADEEGYAESIAYTHPKNAKLVAAAPEMLSALQAIVSHFRFEGGELLASDLCADAIAAVGKAKGE